MSVMIHTTGLQIKRVYTSLGVSCMVFVFHLKGGNTVITKNLQWIAFHLPGPDAKWFLYPMSRDLNFNLFNSFYI